MSPFGHPFAEQPAGDRVSEDVQGENPFDPLDGGVQHVQIGEGAGVVYQHVDAGAVGGHPFEELAPRFGTRQIDRQRADLDVEVPLQLLDGAEGPLLIEPGDDDVVAQIGQPAGVAPSDAAVASRHEGGRRSFRYLSATHGYLIFRSSFHRCSGISSLQLWQHCMSTEYMRAMQ